MSTPEEISKLPNFILSITASQKILQLPKKANKCLIIVSFPNETCGAVLINDVKSTLLTEQAKINVLLQVMSSLKIPFKHLEKYGNVNLKNVNMKAK